MCEYRISGYATLTRPTILFKEGDSMKNMILAIGCAMFMAGNFNAYGASFQKAEMLNQQGLVSESKAELVEVIFSKAVDAEKTQAYFLLGSIAFSEKKVSTDRKSTRLNSSHSSISYA